MIARAFEEDGAAKVAPRYAVGPARVQFLAKNPEAHATFAAQLAEHSDIGSAYTMRGVQKMRPSPYDFVDRLALMSTPLFVMVGDEDDGAIETSLMLKRAVPTAGLSIFPKSGHTLNLEEPALFNRLLDDFIAAVVKGRWKARDLRSLSPSITGMAEVSAVASEGGSTGPLQ